MGANPAMPMRSGNSVPSIPWPRKIIAIPNSSADMDRMT